MAIYDCYKARVYDPVFGRFLQTDPVGSDADLDLYAYVGGDPINRSDPTGKNPAVATAAGIGCAITAEIGCVEGAAIGAGIVIGGTAIIVGGVWVWDHIHHNEQTDDGDTTDAPTAPEANNGDGPKHGGDDHNDAVDNDIKDMRDKGYTDIRKNQTQVNANGQKVGNNRPDAQGTRPDGTREYREQDNNKKNSERHGDQIRNNDPNGVCILGILGNCK